jgi:hypothetical protein
MKSKLFFFIISFTLLFSCVAKKTSTEYKESIVKDTVYKNIKEIIVERFTDTLTIEQPCDSLGNLRPFKKSIKVKQGTVNLTGLNNVITAEIDLQGYKNIWEKEFIKKYNSKTQIKEVEIIKFKTPLWMWGIILIQGLIIFLLIRFK